MKIIFCLVLTLTYAVIIYELQDCGIENKTLICIALMLLVTIVGILL